MKDGNCFNSGFLRPSVYGAWATHYARFIQAYTEANVSVWAITSQNEPYTQTGLWPSNFWTRAQLETFIKGHLAPALANLKVPRVRILAYDDQVPLSATLCLVFTCYLLPPSTSTNLLHLLPAPITSITYTTFHQATGIADDALPMLEGVGDAADGMAFHWYNSLGETREGTLFRAFSHALHIVARAGDATRAGLAKLAALMRPAGHTTPTKLTVASSPLLPLCFFSPSLSSHLLLLPRLLSPASPHLLPLTCSPSPASPSPASPHPPDQSPPLRTAGQKRPRGSPLAYPSSMAAGTCVQRTITSTAVS